MEFEYSCEFETKFKKCEDMNQGSKRSRFTKKTEAKNRATVPLNEVESWTSADADLLTLLSGNLQVSD